MDSVAQFQLAMYSDKLRAMGFVHATSNDRGIIWWRGTDGATATMRAKGGYLPTYRNFKGQLLTADEVLTMYQQLANEKVAA